MDYKYYKRLSLQVHFTFLKICGFVPASLSWTNSNLCFTPHNGWKIYDLCLQALIIFIEILHEVHNIRMFSPSITGVVLIFVPLSYIFSTVGIYIPLTINSNKVNEVMEKTIRASEPLNEVFWKYHLYFTIIGIIFYITCAGLSLTCINWGDPAEIIAELVFSFCCISFGAFTMLFSNTLLIVYFTFRSHNQKIEVGTVDNLTPKRLSEFLEKHNELCAISRELNKICQIGNLTTTAGVLVEILFNVATAIVHGYISRSNYIWVFYVLVKQLKLVLMPSLTALEAKKSSWILSAKTIDSFDSLMLEDVEFFALKQHHNDTSFDACGFFSIDLKLLASIISCTVTYGVIIYQFRK